MIFQKVQKGNGVWAEIGEVDNISLFFTQYYDIIVIG